MAILRVLVFFPISSVTCIFLWLLIPHSIYNRELKNAWKVTISYILECTFYLGSQLHNNVTAHRTTEQKKTTKYAVFVIRMVKIHNTDSIDITRESGEQEDIQELLASCSPSTLIRRGAFSLSLICTGVFSLSSGALAAMGESWGGIA